MRGFRPLNIVKPLFYFDHRSNPMHIVYPIWAALLPRTQHRKIERKSDAIQSDSDTESNKLLATQNIWKAWTARPEPIRNHFNFKDSSWQTLGDLKRSFSYKLSPFFTLVRIFDFPSPSLVPFKFLISRSEPQFSAFLFFEKCSGTPCSKSISMIIFLIILLNEIRFSLIATNR